MPSILSRLFNRKSSELLELKKINKAIPNEPPWAKEIPPLNLVANAQSGRPIYKDWSTSNAIQYGYRASTIVYSCITKLMRSASAVPWYMQQRTSDNTWEPAPDHPFNLVIKKPNPLPNYSWQNIMELITAWLYLGGNAPVFKTMVGGSEPGSIFKAHTTELWPLRPDWVTPVIDNKKGLTGYEYKPSGMLQGIISPLELMHVMFIDPANPFWGMGPLQAASKVVDTDLEAVNFNKISMQNRGVPDSAWIYKGHLSQEQLEVNRKSIRESFLGSDNARTPLVVSGAEWDWKQMGLTPIELDFLKSRKWNAEEICIVFGTSPPVIGLTSDVKYSNMQTARAMFWLDTMIPYLNNLRDAFIHSFDNEWGEDFRINYDVSSVQALQIIFADKIKVAKDIASLGVPFNDINQRLELGFQDIPGGDVGWIASNLIPADSLGGLDDE